jgi:hypothetical protein
VSISAALYIFAWVASLADQFLGARPAGMAAGLALLGFLVLELPRQRRYAQCLFLAMLAAGLYGVVKSAEPVMAFLDAWRRGAVYGAFFFALSTLRDAAETSRLVRRCGQHLVAQPPGRRYAALTGGGHLFGIILSYGAIELLAAMVMRANTLQAAGGSPEVQQLRGRRMLMAIYRGFCVMNCWSPLNLMTAIVSTAVPAAPMRALMPVAFVIAVGMAVLGWAEDRLAAARRGLAGTASPPRSQENWTIHLRIVALVGSVMVLAETASILLHISLVAAVSLAVPMVAVTWIIVQSRRFSAGRPDRALGALRRRLARFALRVPSFRAEATVLASSGFMATAIGGALPAGGIGPLIAHLPPLLVPMLVPVLLIGTGQLGLNPVAVVALLGAAIPDPLAFGVPPSVLAFACMLAWGLCVNMTPMSASAITTARWAGVSPWTVSTRWNAAFVLSALILAWLAIGAAFVIFPQIFTIA